MPVPDHRQTAAKSQFGVWLYCLGGNPEGLRAGRFAGRTLPNLKNSVTFGDGSLLSVSLLLSAFLTANAVISPIYGWTVWLCLFPLFLAIKILPPCQAGIAGGFWGFWLSMFLILADYVPPSHTITSLLFLAGITAVYGYGGAYFTSKWGFRPFVLALGWLGVECALQLAWRTNGLLGLAPAESTIVRTAIGIFGYLFIAFLIMLVNATLLAIAGNIRITLNPCRSFIIPDDLRGWSRQHPVLMPGSPAIETNNPRAPPC